MKLFEYMAKDIFRNNGIAVPEGKMFTNANSVAKFVSDNGPVAIKSQILSGGRGKAGGIKFADTPEEAVNKAEQLLSMQLKGAKVDRVLVEQKLNIEQELYLAITVDGLQKRPVVLASSAGGMEIEEVADDKLIRHLIDIHVGLRPYAAQGIVRRLGLKGELAKQTEDILLKLYELFRTYDAELVEINPLVVSDGKMIAADGKITLDDEAAFRYREDVPIVEDKSPTEIRARELGISFVELDGDIGVMANGAGITMATLDIIQHFGGEPRNFMDAGGGASTEATAKALEVLLSTKPKVLLINIFGGITRCDDDAKAFIQVRNSMEIGIPVVIRLVGTNEQEGIAILRDNGVNSYRDIDAAIAKAVELAKERGKEEQHGNNA